ncbi:MAG: cupin domain-containing protein [Spirochaetes bacterium]|nr:cupin domain-containing protein [Spirochaetota bacterium]
MSIKCVNEEDVKEHDLPGRYLRWLISPELTGAKYNSVCVIRVHPGGTVKPAHSHPEGEEVIYIIEGRGRVLVDGKIQTVRKGTAVLFPEGSVHMLQNTGGEEMKVICFYAPPADLSMYKFYENVEFPD